MTASGLAPDTIHCVVVPEFGGLAHLPGDAAELLTAEPRIRVLLA
jgi:hypothetical protein